MSETPAASRRDTIEFVLLAAAMMALTALSLDMMIPALTDIARAYGLSEPNDRQLVIVIYLLGFSGGHLLHGPLSDRFGRRPVLLAGLGFYVVSTLAALLAPSFAMLLAARACQGIGAAAPRVVAMAMVRDRYTGRHMSRIMSFVMMIFIVVPVVAPMLGAALLQLGPWRLVFGLLLVFASVLLAWSGLRLAETLPRQGLPVPPQDAVRITLTNRQSLGYILALGFLFGNLMTYLGMAEQVFVQVYGMGPAFTLVFGAIALSMVAASFSNARIVERVGMRRVSHTALLVYTGLCLTTGVLGFPEQPPLIWFAVFMAATFFCFGHIAPNFNALAMEPLGRFAGVGSSLVGFYMMAAGAGLGGLVGRQFDGTVRPLFMGFTTLSLLTLLTVLVTERARLMRVGQAHGTGRTDPEAKRR